MTDVTQVTSNTSVALNNLELRNKLLKLIGKSPTFVAQNGAYFSEVDVVVTCCEVSDNHGTGILIQRMFSDQTKLFCIRGADYYGGQQNFGIAQTCLTLTGFSRSEVFSAVASTLQENKPQRVICIPFKSEDVLIAIAVQALYNIPLCTYIMDDPNVYASYVPDDLMQELLEKSTLRLAISPEMKQAYESKYRQKFWVLPPVVASSIIQPNAFKQAKPDLSAKKGILVGNIWGQDWLDRLRNAVRGTGIKIDWYCNNAEQCSWLTFDRADLASEGISIHSALPEPELAEVLKDYAFAVLPSGTLAQDDTRKSIAALSLPSRVSFLLASSQIPILVLGSDQTSAGRFVRRFEVGAVANYEPNAFKAAAERICEPGVQDQMRRNASQICSVFDCQGVDQWIWRSLEKGRAIDERYEKLLPPMAGDLSYYIDPTSRKDICIDMLPMFEGLERLHQRHGFTPDFVMDVGASTGIWSHTMSELFPKSRFILIDPLFSRYDSASVEGLINTHSNFETVEVAISDQNGELELKVSPDFYRSSLFSVGEDCPFELVKVPVKTLDEVAKNRNIKGRGLLKIDVQYAEHLVLAGAQKFLSQVDAVLLELTLMREHPQAKTLLEMLELMDQLGFRYFDDIGDWRDPQTGVLRQKDVLFVQKSYNTDGNI
jgi:FkbM family methyltransferase